MFKQTKSQTNESFLNPQVLLESVPLVSGMTVADFGSGNGYYSVAAGTIVGQKGQVYAIDVMEEALSQTATLSKLVGLRNVTTKQCDLEKFGSCDLAETSCDLVVLSSILHQVENRDNLIREAYRLLKTGGKILVVEWNASAKFGPPVQSRIDEKTASTLLEKNSFRPLAELPAGAFHYALVYGK